MKISIDRAIEILDPVHREHYGSIEEVNEACRMGMKALKRMRWIPVTERLPEVEKEVYVQTESGRHTTAIYEDGKKSSMASSWFWDEIDCDYDEETDTFYVPQGWWEYRHFVPDGDYNNVIDEKVIAWMPLPKPYRPVEEER